MQNYSNDDFGFGGVSSLQDAVDEVGQEDDFEEAVGALLVPESMS